LSATIERSTESLLVEQSGAMAYEEIDGVPIWQEEHGDPAGPALIALRGGILTFEGSFGDVLPRLQDGRRVIGVELQGHGRTADTRPPHVDRPLRRLHRRATRSARHRAADLWGFSLGALTATGVAVRHPERVRRLVLAAGHIRPEGYHPETTAPEQDDPRLPTDQEFAAWQAAYEAVALSPDHFFPFLERMQPVVHDWPGWTDDQVRSVAAPTLLVIGDRDFVGLDHAAEMLDLFSDCRLAVLPGTRHTDVMQRSEQLRSIVEPFLA
jgi:pimeloyl-ACP methyl ester carboxylesterase